MIGVREEIDVMQALLVETDADALAIADELAQAVASGDRSPGLAGLAANYMQQRTLAKRLRRQLKAELAG